MVVCRVRNRLKVNIRELVVGENAISSAESLRSLGVIVDQSLSPSLYFFLICIRRIKAYLTDDATKTLVQCYVISGIDYCISILIFLPKAQLLLL